MGHGDDDTPELRPPGKRRPVSIMSDTQRATIGSEHRRAEAAGLDSESRRARRSAAIPVPVGVPDSGEFDAQSTDEITSPIELIDDEPNEEDREVIQRSKRDSGSPALVEDLAKLVRHFNKHLLKLKSDEKSNNTQRSNQILELLNRPPDEAVRKLVTRIEAVERLIRTFRIVLFLVVGGSGGYGLVIAQRLWDRAESEGESAVRLKHVEQDIDQLRQDIRDSHRYSPAAERPSWLQPPTKAPSP